MRARVYKTNCGKIRYRMNRPPEKGELTLVFLPGLTADHRLFDLQVKAFENEYPILVWDAPGHADSRPFKLDFSLKDKVRWLDMLLEKEGITDPVLIGQSMGGYVAQAYAQYFPGKMRGFIAIDSAPLQRHYMPGWELWLLKHIEPVYRLYPWKALLGSGSKGVSTTEYGRKLMREMMEVYNDDPAEYCRLVGHGYRILAEAIEADLPYRIDCPALLICGKKDRAGATRRYNLKWHDETGILLVMIQNAGHNANCDAPDKVNELIRDMIGQIRG